MEFKNQDNLTSQAGIIYMRGVPKALPMRRFVLMPCVSAAVTFCHRLRPVLGNTFDPRKFPILDSLHRNGPIANIPVPLLL